MKKKNLSGIIAIGIVIFLSSCGKSPVAEIESANASIEKAKQAEAELYAPAKFAALQDSLKVALVMVETQNNKKLKKYADAKEKLQEVVSLSDSVIAKSQRNKEIMKKDIQTLLADVKALLEENKQLITQAPKGKEGTAALAEIKVEIEMVEKSINETSEMFNKGEVIATLDKAKAAKNKAASINTELKDVIARYNQKSGKKG